MSLQAPQAAIMVGPGLGHSGWDNDQCRKAANEPANKSPEQNVKSYSIKHQFQKLFNAYRLSKYMNRNSFGKKNVTLQYAVLSVMVTTKK